MNGCDQQWGPNILLLNIFFVKLHMGVIWASDACSLSAARVRRMDRQRDGGKQNNTFALESG